MNVKQNQEPIACQCRGPFGNVIQCREGGGPFGNVIVSGAHMGMSYSVCTTKIAGPTCQKKV